MKVNNVTPVHFMDIKPYPYCYFDNFFDENSLLNIMNDFPGPKDIQYYIYDNPLEKKMAMDVLDVLKPSVKDFLLYLNSPSFLKIIESITGIDGLIPDPYFRGGGVHQSQNGGKLDVHVDFNIHPKLKLLRKLNFIIYLNKDWQNTWGGALEIWSGYKNALGKHFLDRLEKKIFPHFNRAVIFETSDKSYHGFPEPINCPEYISRKSIATYYYIAPPENNVPTHSTIYVKRPFEDNSLEDLRELRSRNRLSSNV